MILTAQQKQAMIMIEKFIADKDSQVFTQVSDLDFRQS